MSTMKPTLGAAAVAAMLAASAAGAIGSTELDYATVSALPCKDFLEAYGTKRFSSLSNPIVIYFDEKDSGFGSAANISDYVATECRLHEKYKIRQAVDDLFDKKRHHHLPSIPVGGATMDPHVHAQWDAFDKWLRHKGPRPHFE